jgi:hypothetical protein
VDPVDCVFNLLSYGGRNEPSLYIAITPEHTSNEVVTAAWSYVVRYTAKGLDLPDYPAAIAMLAERHPSWTILQSRLTNINVNLAKADSDVPEGGQTE